MSNPNPFKGLAGTAADAPLPTLPQDRTKLIPADEQIVTLSTRVKERVRKKLKKDADEAGMTVQDYLEALILRHNLQGNCEV